MGSANRMCWKVLTIAVVVLTNSAVVLYFARDTLNLPSWLNVLAEIPEIASIVPKSNESNIHFEPVKLSHSQPPTKRVSELDYPMHYTATCMDKRKPAETKTLFTWTDGDGIRHISDKPRIIDGDTSVKVAGIIKPDAISINFLSHNLTYEIKKRVLAKVDIAIDTFAEVTPEEAIVPIIAKIKSFKDRSAYDAYRKTQAPTLKASTGFYSAASNESAVLIRSENQTIGTIVHEITHTINRHWYGQMVIWLNEGMAEYSEHPKDITKNSWFNYLSNNKPVSLAVLFRGDKEDWRMNSAQFYATSWAFVSFLMTENKEVMSRMLLVESENGCSEISRSDVEKLYGKNLAGIERDFLHWLRRTLP